MRVFAFPLSSVLSGFKFLQGTTGTTISAIGPTDTLTFSSSDSSVTFCGCSSTDTFDVTVGTNKFWKTTGNASTVAGTNFIGTTDNIDFVAKRQNTELIRLASGGVSINGSGLRSTFSINGNGDATICGVSSICSWGFNIVNTQTNSTAAPCQKYGACITTTGSWAPSSSANVYGLYFNGVSGGCASACTIDIGFSSGQSRFIRIDSASSGPGNDLTILSGAAAAGATNCSGGTINIQTGFGTGCSESFIKFITSSGAASGTTTLCAVQTATFGRSISFLVSSNISGCVGGTGFLVTGATYACLGIQETNDVFFNLAQTKGFCTAVPCSFSNQRAFRITAPTYTSGPCTTTITKIATLAISGAPTVGANVVNSATYALDLESGDLNFTNGNALFQTVSNGFKIKEGTNARMGLSTLVAGTVTVANTSVTANTRVFLSRETVGGTIGHLNYAVAANSFTITSSSILETSNVAWLLIEKL